jgi:hypothetical protein
MRQFGARISATKTQLLSDYFFDLCYVSLANGNFLLFDPDNIFIDAGNVFF